MHITEPKIDDYIMKAMPGRDEVLLDMEAYARENNFPIIGPMCGIFLRQLALAMGAKRVFEMGSGFGYSAYWLAGGMSGSGKVICTDTSKDNKNRAMNYFTRGGCTSMVDFKVGDALDIIQTYSDEFDIIVNDVDKQYYPKAFDLAIPRLRKGGLFITDNVLWGGDILEDQPDEQSRAILEFNRKLFEAQNVLSSIIPIRDGLGIAVKL